MSDTPAPELLVSTEGKVARLRLNRPKAIHALTRGMCVTMSEALLEWREQGGIELVLLDHAAAPHGDPKLSRGFCAGGDVIALWNSGKTDGVEARRFFFDEYRLNHLLFVYATPIVAFMDGIVMGGGVGISQPAKYRIATERTAFAMPETGIGLFPDVGGGWYLSRLPGRVGHYLGVTGSRINGAECLALGLATHYIPSEKLEDLKAKLIAEPGKVASLLAEASETPPEAPIEMQRADIDRLFASDDFDDILAALDADLSGWAQKQRAILAGKSPQACKVSLQIVVDGAKMPFFADEMAQEYAVASRVVMRNDFIEGVRALLVDKDNAPRWAPATADQVSGHLIDQIFAPLPDGEAWTPLPL